MPFHRDSYLFISIRIGYRAFQPPTDELKDRAMPRKPRVHVPNGIYHLILRGNARRDIFCDRADRELWQKYLCESVRFFEVNIHAYCWMTNHIHIAAQAGSQPIGSFMGVIATRSARYRISDNKFCPVIVFFRPTGSQATVHPFYGGAANTVSG